MAILAEKKIGDEKQESSSEEESDVDSDEVPGDDFELGEGGEDGEEGSDSDDDEEEEDSDEEELDDTLKEEEWQREAKSNENAKQSSDEEGEAGEGSDEEMEEEGDDEASDEDEVDEEGNTGWADAMAKVLAMGKNSEKPVGVLSKAKKDNAKQKDSEGKVLEPLALRKARKRELDSIGRSMPNPLQRNAERTLTKIATRGVVQLFNAVREQQKDMKSQLKQAGGSFRKQEKVLKTINKENFINMLSGKATVRSEEPAEKRSRVEREVEEEEEEMEEKEEKQSSWSILRDDFMLGAKLKDWDQESDGD